MNTTDIELAAETLPDDAPAEQVREVRDRLQYIQEFARKLKAIVDARMIAWIERNGTLTIGDVRYYVGDDKTTKCKDKAATLDALFNATGGDIAAVAMLMASDPFKPGACREPLADLWTDHFEVISKPKLLEGKPVKSLQAINTAMVRGPQ